MIPEYLKLLIRRESRDVLGRGWVNLWLLMVMLFAMYLAIAFSNGSMSYLDVKMNDPFTNWVNITNGFGSSHFDEFVDRLGKEDTKERFHFDDVQLDYSSSKNFRARNGNVYTFDTRFFERPNSSLVQAILDDDNVVDGASIPFEYLTERTYGFIISRDALKKLGYDENEIPAYIDFHSYSIGADTLGVELDDGFAAAPVPVLAVVDRLPDNKDIIGAKYFFEQYQNSYDYPLNLNNPDYQRSLLYYVPEELGEEEFAAIVSRAVPDSLSNAYMIAPNEKDGLKSWHPGRMCSLYLDNENTLPLQVFVDIAAAIGKEGGVVRLYDYSGRDYTLPESQYLSVNFINLDSIRSFERFAKDDFGVKIEMSQINAKENFNEVSILATVLSWAMIVFSIVCIVIFLINMLQSYFKKVSRNIGTFKAFGIDSGELVRAYEGLLMVIVLMAMAGALLAVWLLQMILPLAGCLKAGEYSYLLLWSPQTLYASLTVIVSMSVTVWFVMGNMLRKTPGDLIYDR